MVGLGVQSASVRSSISMETTCGAMLQELEQIWTEIGENEEDKDRMFLELEKECMQVYRRKVDEANTCRARLHQSLVAKEAELASLVASLGEHTIQMKKIDNRSASLKEQLAAVSPLLEDLKVKKEERIKQLADIRIQIDKINADIAGCSCQHDSLGNYISDEEHDLSLRKLTEYQAQLRSLQKEKSDRLHKVLEYVNEVHSLCGVLGVDFGKTVDEVHPSLHETGSEHSTNISDTTIEGLSQVILKLKTEKKMRMQRLREAVKSLLDLWDLMDSPEEERTRFGKVTSLGSSEQDITCSGLLSLDTIEQTEVEVEKLTKLKASRVKELVLKRRSELEEICRSAHIEPDMSTSSEKASALMDSGLVDPYELLANIETQIMKAKEESTIRKEIMDKVNKWLAACNEENWLEQYNQDENKYSAGRGSHLNLKRAEKARVAVTKIPAAVENLMNRVLLWEEERSMPFLFDGVRLVSILEEYKLTRQHKEEEKKRLRDQKKIQNMLLTEKEALYGSKPSPRKNTFNKKANFPNGSVNGFMTPNPRRMSIGSVTSELFTPHSCSGRQNGYFKEMRRLSTAPLNFVAISKEDTVSSFASISGSEPGSPPLN